MGAPREPAPAARLTSGAAGPADQAKWAPKAKVATARKAVVILHRMWIDGTSNWSKKEVDV